MSSGDDNESPPMGHDFRVVWRDLANEVYDKMDDLRDALNQVRRELELGNLVNKIAKNRGWLPLTVDEEMQVSFNDGTTFKIKRVK
jgi:hypothetical protein